MALFRRNKTWWTDFSVNGQRFRQSLDTIDWREALREEKKLIAQESSRRRDGHLRGSLSSRPPSATSIAESWNSPSGARRKSGNCWCSHRSSLQ